MNLKNWISKCAAFPANNSGNRGGGAFFRASISVLTAMKFWAIGCVTDLGFRKRKAC
jgi:hypothetical protein